MSYLELDALLLHELSHLYRDWDLDKHPDGDLANAQFLQQLMSRDLNTRLSYKHLRDLAKTKCKECDDKIPPRPDLRNYFFP